MTKYTFLSEEWVDQARKIREDYRGRGAKIPHAVKMNQVITDVPFGEGVIEAHMDTSSGELEMDHGHLDDADVKLTLEYATAKAIFVEGNPQAGMQAFMAGRIKVEGDMTKLMAMQTVVGTPDETGAEMQQRIREITA